MATLRAYAKSCQRLEALQADHNTGTALHGEVRTNLSLLRELNLEKAPVCD